MSDDPLPYDQQPTAPPPPGDARAAARPTDRLRPLASIPPDQSGAVRTPRDPRHDWLRTHPGVDGFGVASASGEATSAVGAMTENEIQMQVYLAMLARRVGEELGLAQLAELTLEGADARLFMSRHADGSALHVVGSKDLNIDGIRRAIEDER